MFQDLFTKDRIAQSGAAIVAIVIWAAVLLPGIFSHGGAVNTAEESGRPSASADYSVPALDAAIDHHRNRSKAAEADDHASGALISGAW